MGFVEHKLIRKGSLESRTYQEAILGIAAENNLLCVLPTGLGKTPVAIVLSVFRLERYPDSKILILAPTKPLIEQHLNTFREVINLPEDEFALLTGMTKPEEREESYRKSKIIFATPQTVRNDLKNERLDLSNFSLVVFDEAHHSIGDYAYPYIAKVYLESSQNPRILGLTASPGGTKEKIREIMENLGIEKVEIRTEEDFDVAPFVKKKQIEWVNVELPQTFFNIREGLRKAYEQRLKQLRKIGFSKPVRLVTKRDLLDLQKKLMSGPGGYKKFWGVSLVSQAIKSEHALSLVETQGINSLESYFKKLRSEKAKSSKSLVKDRNIRDAMLLAKELSEKGFRHPKIRKLCEIVSSQFRENPRSKIIVFANYRNMVREIVSVLSEVENSKPIEFMGQKEGLTQKEQKKRISDFREGRYNILVTTSVGEEGIDIPEMELAVFYEPVPSEIRSIQRRGRVGRTKLGKIMILITKKTRDEAYYWTAHRKESVMKKTLYRMKGESSPKKRGQTKLEDFKDL
ncbi:MAG: DEAD/DEAH box helicase [Candidatus Aenigmarchaeota archaeon]|nr:DEAD/DEAH box helicase [Candidatus Aenigmarchaeota archaeon]NIP40798.1 DEAD/DEAH box helicase [Candidatus Aenigmarchaeota archaeon]NIQ17912.1 DEAD/DEAH box helicase [Candidatus Aenigmarchaeota archaeon]NIS73501.1 DEAD/DEAH box helicase [Candidatus Aenigmarchaeota archaeon]